MPKATGVKRIAENRKAFHDYFSTYIVFQEMLKHGHEVYVVTTRTGIFRAVWDEDGRVLRLAGIELKFLYGYQMSSFIHPFAIEEIRKLHARIQQDGLTLVPLSCYLKDSRVKLEIGLARGKKLYDKRESSARRDAEREIDRTIKERNR